jgi:thiol-disulfide isomerase/thioredoxin
LDKGQTLESRLEAPSFPSTTLADYDWIVQSLDGQDFKMSDVKGKVVFLNFWATWCPPCVAEMPSIQRLHEKLKDEGIVFVCISNEEVSKVNPVRNSSGTLNAAGIILKSNPVAEQRGIISNGVNQFAKEKGVTFPIYTMHGTPPPAFKTRGIPATFILSPDGKIAFKHIGSAKWDDDKSIDFIKGLMK